MARARLIFNILFTRGQTHRYGSHRSQLADLHLPSGSRASGGPYPVMILLHGGSWQKRYGRVVMRGLVRDLLRRGWAVWNIEYRRLGDGGGWPMTFADVAAAIDELSELGDARLDLSRVNILGHSPAAISPCGRPAERNFHRTRRALSPARRACAWSVPSPRPVCAISPAAIAIGAAVR